MGLKNPNILVAVIGAGTAVLTSVFAAMATANTQIMTVDTKVQVNERQQNLQYNELKEGISRIEGKLDKVIENNR